MAHAPRNETSAATRRLLRLSRTAYWVTRSARCSNVWGVVRPSAFALLRLTTREPRPLALRPARAPVDRPSFVVGGALCHGGPKSLLPLEEMGFSLSDQ